MKKVAAIAVTAVIAMTLGGCGGSSAASSAASSSAESVSSEAVSEASSSASSASAPVVNWTTVKTAEEAAKGAGFETFGVMDKIEINDTDFMDPAFAYAEGVAQADYETGAMGLFVRKAEGTHTAPLTDRDKAEFAETWTKTIDDIDVTCYGAARGATTVMTWKDGDKEYGVTFQGLGGEEVSMESDEVEEIVTAIKKAETPEVPEPQKTESSEAAQKTDDSDEFISEDDAKSAAVSAAGMGIPEEVIAEFIYGGDAPHYDVTLTSGDDTRVIQVDAYTGEIWGNVEVDSDDDDADDDSDDADDSGEFISEDEAESAAVAHMNAGVPDEVESELVVGGDAPHYVVTITYDGDERTVEVDAYTGDVWE